MARQQQSIDHLRPRREKEETENLLLAWDNETFKGRRFPRNCGPQGSREQRVASPEPKEGLCRCPTKGNAVRRNRQITIVGIADLVPILSLSLSFYLEQGHTYARLRIHLPDARFQLCGSSCPCS